MCMAQLHWLPRGFVTGAAAASCCSDPAAGSSTICRDTRSGVKCSLAMNTTIKHAAQRKQLCLNQVLRQLPVPSTLLLSSSLAALHCSWWLMMPAELAAAAARSCATRGADAGAPTATHAGSNAEGAKYYGYYIAAHGQTHALYQISCARRALAAGKKCEF
jgi:hypothetical protein